MPAHEIGDLRKRVHDLEETRRLAENLSQVQTVTETLRQIADWCARLCDADFVSILLFREGVEHSVLTVAKTGEVDAGIGIDHGLNKLIAGHVKIQRKHFIADDVIISMGLHSPSERQKEYGPALAVSLDARGEIIGVLNMVNKRGRRSFTSETLRLAESTAPLISRFIERARIHEKKSLDHALLQTSAPAIWPPQWIPSVAPAMQSPMEQLGKVAPTNAAVLLTGETGTGKELFARALHLQSPRALKPFVALNCSAIPAALFESELFGHEKGAFTGADFRRIGDLELADGGTLFLDEISAMPRELQPKLLRVLEGKKFRSVGSSVEQSTDFRLISATNRDITGMIASGEFREDLFHRINVIPINLPPLRERSEDITSLAREFITEFSGGKQQFTMEAVRTLRTMEWRGNVRELRNYVERLSILCEKTDIDAGDLAPTISGPAGHSGLDLNSAFQAILRDEKQSGHLLKETERQLIVSTLETTSGNISMASRLLGITRSSLQRKIKELQVKYHPGID